jgi:electron transfer flavoprotein beta subunit
MKVLVPMQRRSISTSEAAREGGRRGVETAGVKMSMNPFDEIAVEEPCA